MTIRLRKGKHSEEKRVLILVLLSCGLSTACGQGGAQDTAPASSTVREPAAVSELYLRGDGAVYPDGGFSAITYQCGLEALESAQQNACTQQLALVLESYRLEPQPEIVDGESPLPTGRCFTVWPALESDWQPILTFFESRERSIPSPCIIPWPTPRERARNPTGNTAGMSRARCWRA